MEVNQNNINNQNHQFHGLPVVVQGNNPRAEQLRLLARNAQDDFINNNNQIRLLLPEREVAPINALNIDNPARGPVAINFMQLQMQAQLVRRNQINEQNMIDRDVVMLNPDDMEI